MVRAAVEEGLTHHNPDTLHELMRTGVYKESEEGVQLDRDEKKVGYFVMFSTSRYLKRENNSFYALTTGGRGFV